MMRSALFLLVLSPLMVASAPIPKARPSNLKEFGTVVDPSKQCKFDAEGTKLKITLPDIPLSLTDDAGRSNAPRVWREIEGDFSVTVRVAVTFPDNPVTDVPDQEPAVTAGLILGYEKDYYVTLQRSHAMLGNKRMTTNELHYNEPGNPGTGMSSAPKPLKLDPFYLRIIRQGQGLFVETSEDGKTWVAMSQPKLPLTKSVFVGVMCENTTGASMTATFDQYELKSASGQK